MIKPIHYTEIQREKKAKKNKKLAKEILFAILAGAVFILAMWIASGTFPY